VDAKKPAPATVRGEGRQALLDAARAVFAEKGFARAGIREIANRAGVAIAVAYWHFKSKRGLFEAAVTEPILAFVADFFAAWGEQEPGRQPAVDEAVAYFSGLYDVLHQERELLLAMLADREFSGEHTDADPLESAFDQLLDLHEQMIKAEIDKRGYRHVDTYMWTRIFFASILSMALHGSLIDARQARTKDEFVRQLAEMSIRGTRTLP